MLVVGSMIGSGIFIVSAGYRPPGTKPRAAPRRLAGSWNHDADRRAELWRTGSGHASRRRAIRLPARIAWPDLGLPLRLDHAVGHPNGDHRRGGHCVCEVYGGNSALVFSLRVDLEDRHVRALAIVVRRAGSLQCRTKPPESAGHLVHFFPDLGKHARPGLWQSGAERIYGHQSILARGAGDTWVLVLHHRGATRRTSRISGATLRFPQSILTRPTIPHG